MTLIMTPINLILNKIPDNLKLFKNNEIHIWDPLSMSKSYTNTPQKWHTKTERSKTIPVKFLM